MHTEGPREDPLVDMGYEIRDVNYPSLRKAIVYFFGFAVSAWIVGALIYYNRFSIFGVASNETASKTVVKRVIPGEPLLQGNVTAKTDLMDLRQAETKQLTSTGYVDPTQTVVHIPIDRAMDLLVSRGLPTTSNEVSADSRGVMPVKMMSATPATTPSPVPAGAKVPVTSAPTVPPTMPAPKGTAPIPAGTIAPAPALKVVPAPKAGLPRATGRGPMRPSMGGGGAAGAGATMGRRPGTVAPVGATEPH